MAIFSPFGNELTITAYCGKHSPLWDKKKSNKMVLVRVKERSEICETYYFAHTLKADDGWHEIDKAVDAAPVVDLTAEELRLALKEAE